VLASHKQTGIDIKGRDMAKLAPGCWLNDEIVNVYIGMLQERDTRRRDGGAHVPKCHFFNSFFTSKLYLESGKYDYSAVRRWTMPKRLKTTGQRSDSILDCDRIIIPVNKGGMHWVCAVIDLKGSKFVLYDSLGGTDHVLLANLAKYVCDEYKNKRDAEVRCCLCSHFALMSILAANWQRRHVAACVKSFGIHHCYQKLFVRIEETRTLWASNRGFMPKWNITNDVYVGTICFAAD
jgi:hypothetical protein